MPDKNYYKPRLVIFPCVIFIFVTIFSSTTLVSAAVAPPKISQVKTLDDKGQALLRLGKYNQSIAYYDRALAINPNDVSALTSKGFALGGFGKKYNEAITYYDKALSIQPNYVRALTSKGYALAGLGKYNEAITYYDKALAINRSDVSAMTGIGIALGGLGKYNEAIIYYDKALAINPNLLAASKAKEMTLADINSTKFNSRKTQ